MNTSETLRETSLTRQLDTQVPASILALGPGACGVFTEFAEHHPQTRLDCLETVPDTDAVKALGGHELVFVSGVIEYMDKTRAGQLIALLRDLYSKRLYIRVPIGEDWPGLTSHWEPTELIAYGLRLADKHTIEGRALHLYRFDLYDYKITPQWLNSRHWANPEHWDKHRW